MCGDKASAIPNTHTLLRATIIVDTAPSTAAATTTAATTSRSSSRASITPSTTSDSSTISTTADPTTLVPSTTSQTTSDSASTSEGNIATPTAPASSEDSTASPVAGTQLSSPQLAGIVVASVGAAVLAIAAIAVAACLRRRRRRSRERDSDTDSLPFQNEPSNGEKYFQNGLGNGPVGPLGGPLGGKKTPPARFPIHYGDPGISLPTDQIGVAVSPETKKYIMPSNGLPEKPKLRLYVPPEPIAKDEPLEIPRNKNEYYGQGVPNRDSSMTQFEEDNTPFTPFSYEENNTTYYGLPNGDVKSSLPITQPRAGASENGLRPQDIRQPARSFSQPLQAGTATSSVYSGRSSPRDSAANYQNGRQPQQSPYRAYTPYRQPSQQGAAELPTDYNNQALPSETTLVPAPLRRKSHVNDRRSVDLSPVVESPVSYPKIPKLSPTFAYPPPKQPNFQRLQNPRTSAGSGMSAESTSSSLLEKRRGKEQADALVLGRVDGKAPAGGKNGWRVVPGSGGNEGGWRPQQNGSGRSFMNFQGERGQVPMSPSPWELTPKKMGDDLFLTVR